MRKAAVQSRMTLDIITASQGGTCAIIKTECCVYTPDESGKMTSIWGVYAKTDTIPEGSHSMQYSKHTNIKKLFTVYLQFKATPPPSLGFFCFHQ